MFSDPYPIHRSFPLCLLYGLHASAKKYVSSEEIVSQLLVTCALFLVGLFCLGTLHTFLKHPLMQFPISLRYFQDMCIPHSSGRQSLQLCRKNFYCHYNALPLDIYTKSWN